jgi:hypothetical protein
VGKAVRISGDLGGKSAPFFASDISRDSLSSGLVAVWDDGSGPDQSNQNAAGLCSGALKGDMPTFGIVNGGTFVDDNTNSANPEIAHDHGLAVTA